jgi:hypothetical protein
MPGRVSGSIFIFSGKLKLACTRLLNAALPQRRAVQPTQECDSIANVPNPNAAVLAVERKFTPSLPSQPGARDSRPGDPGFSNPGIL